MVVVFSDNPAVYKNETVGTFIIKAVEGYIANRSKSGTNEWSGFVTLGGKTHHVFVWETAGMNSGGGRFVDKDEQGNQKIYQFDWHFNSGKLVPS